MRGFERVLAVALQLVRFFPQYVELKRAPGERRFALELRHLRFCLSDATPTTTFDRHYVYHTAWAARVLAKTRPHVHIDISSSLYFAGISSAFVPIRFFDYRPVRLGLSGLTTEGAD